MITQSLDLSDLQKDALKEVGNIGAGHAATSLSQLLNATIKISQPSIDVIKFRDLSTRVGYEQRLVAALHMYVRGEAPGQMIVLFDREHALDYVGSFISRVIGDIQIFDSIVDSTLKVLGNIMAGAYLARAQLAHRRRTRAFRSGAVVRHRPGGIPQPALHPARPGRFFDRIVVSGQAARRLGPLHPDPRNRLAARIVGRVRRRLKDLGCAVPVAFSPPG